MPAVRTVYRCCLSSVILLTAVAAAGVTRAAPGAPQAALGATKAALGDNQCPPGVGQFLSLNGRQYQKEANILIKTRRRKGNGYNSYML